MVYAEEADMLDKQCLNMKQPTGLWENVDRYKNLMSECI